MATSAPRVFIGVCAASGASAGAGAGAALVGWPRGPALTSRRPGASGLLLTEMLLSYSVAVLQRRKTTRSCQPHCLPGAWRQAGSYSLFRSSARVVWLLTPLLVQSCSGALTVQTLS